MSVAEIHRAARGRTGTDGRMNFVDEQDWHRALRERVDDRLEAFLEVAAEPGAGEQCAGIEREDLSALEQIRHVVLEQPRCEPLRERGLADAGIAHEYGIVLPAPAEDLHRPLEFIGAADERVELARLGARGEVHRVGRERIAGRRGPALSLACASASLGVGVVGGDAAGRGHFADAVGDELEHVEASDALVGKQLRRVRLVLLQRRGEDVAGLHFLASRTLHVKDGRLQHAPERERLLGFLLLAAPVLFDGLLQIFVEIAAKLRQIGAAGGEDALAVVIVREGVEQVLERQMSVTPGGRLAVRHRQDDL